MSWPKDGPLGYANMRRQRGRSANMGGPNGKLREILLQAGVDDDEVGDALASRVAITLGYEDGNQANAALPQYVRALVEWGTAGVQHRAYCDFINGAVVHVTGSSYRVVAEVTPRAADDVPLSIPAESVAICSATIGYWGGGLKPAQLTQQATTVDTGVGAEAVFRVPPFASRFTCYQQSNPGVIWRISPNGPAINSGFTFTPETTMPVPGVAQYLSITGNPPGELCNVIWYLSI